MKLRILLIGFLLGSTPIMAQNDSDAPLFKNEVKLVVSDLINGSYMFGYERAIGKHIGVALNVGYKSKDGLLQLSGLDTDLIKTDDLSYDGFKIRFPRPPLSPKTINSMAESDRLGQFNKGA